MKKEYQHMVDAQNPGHVKLYDGTDAADAMAAWSKAISMGVEYVTLESMVRPRAPKAEEAS